MAQLQDDGDLALYMRESHMVRCDACGATWDEWDTGISVGEAIARIQRDSSALENLYSLPCPFCANRIEWDVAILSGDSRRRLAPSRQRRLASTVGHLLRAGAGAEQIEETIRDRYGVIGFFTRAKSERPR